MSDSKDNLFETGPQTGKTPAGDTPPVPTDAQLDAILAELRDKSDVTEETSSGIKPPAAPPPQTQRKAPLQEPVPQRRREPPPRQPLPQDEPIFSESNETEFYQEPSQISDEMVAPPKKRKSSVLLNILLIVCIVGVVVSAIGLTYTYMRYKVAADEYTDLRQYAQVETTGDRVIDLAALRAINPDTIGWLEIPDTNIDYPLLQSLDNQYYLQYTFNKTWNPSGAIYLDSECEADFSMRNSLIYGHHMKDGSMFAELKKYVEDPAFLEAHKEIRIYTDEGIRIYEVFRATQANIKDDEMQIWFEDGDTEAAWLTAMGAQSEDSVITLVTCVNYYDSTDERYVAQAALREIKPMPED